MKKAINQSKLIFALNLSSILLLLLILASLGVTTLQSRAADKANEDRFVLTENATLFMNASAFLTSEVRAYAATGDKQHYDNYMNELNQLKSREKSVDAMKAIGVTVEEQAKIDEMLALSNQLVPLETKALEGSAAGDLRTALTAVLGAPYNNIITEIVRVKSEFLNMLFQRTSKQVNAQILATRFLEVQTLFLILAIIILQLVAYRITRKKVILPILAVEGQMRSIAQGNLAAPFPLEPDTSEIGMLIDSIISTKAQLNKYISDISDKLAQMASQNLTIGIDMDYIGDFAPIKDALIKITRSLNAALYQITETADEVSSGSIQVSDSAQALAAGVSEQAVSVEQVSAVIVRIAEQIQQTADKSGMATELANAAGVQLGRSNEQLQGMLRAMNEISDASGEIGKIIKTIEDIAFQTNILALNAAVEAARAGGAGKGFAVVADEVRNLANKSAEASKNTSVMIENSLHTIQSGAKIAQDASETFVTVMVNAGRAAEAMGDISTAAHDQANEIAEVTHSIGRISAVVQGNSTSSGQSAAASEQLMQHAESLRALARQFQLNPSVPTVPSAYREV